MGRQPQEADKPANFAEALQGFASPRGIRAFLTEVTGPAVSKEMHT